MSNIPYFESISSKSILNPKSDRNPDLCIVPTCENIAILSCKLDICEWRFCNEHEDHSHHTCLFPFCKKLATKYCYEIDIECCNEHHLIYQNDIVKKHLKKYDCIPNLSGMNVENFLKEKSNNKLCRNELCNNLALVSCISQMCKFNFCLECTRHVHLKCCYLNCQEYATDYCKELDLVCCKTHFGIWSDDQVKSHLKEKDCLPYFTDMDPSEFFLDDILFKPIQNKLNLGLCRHKTCKFPAILIDCPSKMCKYNFCAIHMYHKHRICRYPSCNEYAITYSDDANAECCEEHRVKWYYEYYRYNNPEYHN